MGVGVQDDRRVVLTEHGHMQEEDRNRRQISLYSVRRKTDRSGLRAGGMRVEKFVDVCRTTARSRHRY